MKTLIILMLSCFIIMTASGQNWYEMKYKPATKKNVAQEESNGKMYSIVTKAWLESFINERSKQGFKVTYDEYNEESDGNDFIVFSKGNFAIAIFDYNDKAYIATKHMKLKTSEIYLKCFYPSWFNSKESTSLEKIKKLLNAEIKPLYKETLAEVLKF